MADPILVDQDGAFVTRDGKLVLVRPGQPCACCGDPIPGEPWVKGTPCDCSSSGEPEAWMRTSDYLSLRTQGQCPTGRLPDGSCWEMLRGAETRTTTPPAAQQLVPFGVGGCCVCCPGCAKTRVFFPQQVGCGPETFLELDACCASTDRIPFAAYFRRELYVLEDGPCGPAGVGVAQRFESWAQCDETGCTGTARDRRWDFFLSGCPLARDEITNDQTFAQRCTQAGVYLGRFGFTNLVEGFPIECGTAGTPTGGGRSGPRGARWDGSWFQSTTSGPVRAGRSLGTITRGVPPDSGCDGRCVEVSLSTAIPPHPLDSAGPFSGLRFASRARNNRGCANCGNDGGL